MAKKIFSKGNLFYVVDSVTNVEDTCFISEARVDRKLSTSTDFVVSTKTESYPLAFADIVDEAGVAYGSIAVFKTFYESNTGFNPATTASVTAVAELLDTKLNGADGSFLLVNSKLDLPMAVSNVITLLANVTYYFTTTVDLTGDRIVCGANTVILGASSENSKLTSTGLSASTALITSIYSLPIRNITFTSGTVFNLDGDATTTAIDWHGVNFLDCATVGTIKGYTNVIIESSAFLNSANLTLDGTIGTVGFINSLFDGRTGQTTIIVPATANITRRFRIIYSSFVCLSGETGINISNSATIADEKYILDTVNFSGGGTYLSGLTGTSNKALYTACVGITNTAVNGQLYMNDNATATTVSATNTYYKVLGTTLPSTDNSKYTHTNNRLTNDAAIRRKYLIHCSLSFNSGNNNVCQFGFYDSALSDIRTPSKTKSTANGSGRSENISFSCVVSHILGDYLEIHCANTSAITNITVIDMNFIITEIK